MTTLPAPRASFSIGGVDLGDIGIFEDFGSVFATPPRRGGGYVLPGVDNEIAVTLPRESYDISVGVTLVSDEEDPDAALAELVSMWGSIDSVCDTGATVSVNRVVGTTNETAYAQNLRAEPQFLSSWHCRVTISMRIVTGWASA